MFQTSMKNITLVYVIQVFDELPQWRNWSISEGITRYIRRICFLLGFEFSDSNKLLMET